MSAALSIRCPRCGRVSHHPDDVKEGYCGACHAWTADPVVPRGVRVRRPDGTEVECSLVRDLDGPEGFAVWLAEPVDGSAAVPGADALMVAYLPARTEIRLRFC